MEFSFGRVRLLIKKQLAENRQLYFFSLLIIAGIMFVVFLANLTDRMGFNAAQQGAMFVCGLAVIGSVFTSTLFNQFSNKIKGIQNLVLPASILEKLVTAIIFSLILFPVAYTIVVYPVLIVAHIIDLNLGHLTRLFVFDYLYEMKFMLTLFIVLQPLVLICSLLFKRYTTIKTAVVLGGLWFTILILNPNITEHYIKNARPDHIRIKEVYYDDDQKIIKTVDHTQVNNTSYLYSMAFNDIRFTATDFDSVLWVRLPDKQDLLFEILMYLSIPFLYLVAWFRIREIEL